jgi:hypothetical protein
MDEKQFEQIMTALKDIKKRVMLLSFGVGITLGIFVSIVIQRI